MFFHFTQIGYRVRHTETSKSVGAGAECRSQPDGGVNARSVTMRLPQN